MNNSIITAEVINGTAYYTATARGVSYCAQELAGKWFVGSRRLALGRHFNTGGGKYYETLEAVANGCKAFSGLDALVAT